MQTWKYYDYMGGHNPVCEFAGKITKIIPNYPEKQGTYTKLEAIVADGIFFVCDVQIPFIERSGCVNFLPIFPFVNDTQTLPDGIKCGDEVKMKQNAYWIDKEGIALGPLCEDPRVLYIMHRAVHLPARPTDKQLADFCADIPDRKAAVTYLTEQGWNFGCTPPHAGGKPRRFL